MSNKFIAISEAGKLRMSDYNADRFRKDLKNNPGARYKIERLTPESKEQRGFYHGGVLSLWAFLNDLDHKDSNIIEELHHYAKKEFNGMIIILEGKKKKVGKSTKGILNTGYIEKVIEYLEENYAIDRATMLNPEEYKRWRDEIAPYSKIDNYIDFLVEQGILKK